QSRMVYQCVVFRVLWRYRALFCFFFFSSRRRHTRSKRDWSSDVCSSDLGMKPLAASAATRRSVGIVVVIRESSHGAEEGSAAGMPRKAYGKREPTTK